MAEDCDYDYVVGKLPKKDKDGRIRQAIGSARAAVTGMMAHIPLSYTTSK